MELFLIAAVLGLLLAVYQGAHASQEERRSATNRTAGSQLKGSIRPAGGWGDPGTPNVYDLMETMGRFFLRKRHEWCLVAFVRLDGGCSLLWGNKGEGPDSVSVGLLPPEAVEKALAIGATAIIVAHNHPASQADRPSGVHYRDHQQANLGFSDQDEFTDAHWRACCHDHDLVYGSAVYVGGAWIYEMDPWLHRQYARSRHWARRIGHR